MQPVKGYGAVIFRRESPQITATGGLWDTSQLIYPHANGKPRQTPWLGWKWLDYGTSVRFHHLQHEDDKLAWQGSQLDFVGFDELTHFTESQFFYLLSRVRSTCGVKPVMRATTNPDPESWVRRFLAPWVDDEYADPAKSGEVRWFYREGDDIVWLRSVKDRPDYIPLENVHSATFIEAHLEDNPALMQSDPGYKGRIQALPLVERIILSGGPQAWKVRREGNMFKRHWFPVVDAAPAEFTNVVRRWDLAGTEPKKGRSDPDWTCGVKMGRTKEGRYYILDVIFIRESPGAVKATVKQTAELDGKDVAIRIPQDPGQAGKDQRNDYFTLLDGYNMGGKPETGDKVTRAGPFSSQCEAMNVFLLKGAWNNQYINQMVGFPNVAIHDDAVDASSGAYTELISLYFGIPLHDEPLPEEITEQSLTEAIKQGQADPFAWAAAHGGWDD